MASFPLLRLPYCAQKVILDVLTPMDLFTLSHTSKRAGRIMKYSDMKHLKLELEYDGEENSGNFLIEKDNISYCFFVVSRENFHDDGQFHINEGDGNYYFYIYCDDVCEQVKIILKHFRRVFKMELSILELCSIDKKTFKSITDVIITQQSELELLKLKNIKVPALEITKLLQKVKNPFNYRISCFL